MSNNHELDRLKAAEQSAFQRKQDAFQAYATARDQASAAYEAMQEAWEDRVSARETMNREFEARETAFKEHDSIWAEYTRIREYNSPRIDALRRDADDEHREMQACFENASNAYQYGNKADARSYSEEGREHKARRNELNEEIGELIREIKDAKAHAETYAPRVDSSAFNRAKADFDAAKSAHEAAQSSFNRLKAQRDQLKAEFDALQAEFLRCKDAFQEKLAEVKGEKTGWGPYIYGSIDGNPVTVRQGTGHNTGQTLIADGHVSGKQFHGKNGQRGHNHYGPDNRYGSGKRIEDLGGDRGKYTGPGY